MISHRSPSGAFLLAAWGWAATSAGARAVELDAATCRPGSAKTTPSDDLLMGCMMLRKQCANGVEASCARIGLTRAQAGPPGPPIAVVVPPATTRATSTDVPITTMTFFQSDIDTPPLARDLSDEGRAALAYIGTTKLWIPGGFVSDGQARRPVPANAELLWTISGQGSGGSLLVRAYPKQKLDLVRGAMSLSAIAIGKALFRSVTVGIAVSGMLLFEVLAYLGGSSGDAHFVAAIELIGVGWIGVFAINPFLMMGRELDLTPDILIVRDAPWRWALVAPLGILCAFLGQALLGVLMPGLVAFFAAHSAPGDVERLLNGGLDVQARFFLVDFLPSVAHDVLLVSLAIALVVVPLAAIALTMRRMRTGAWI